MLPTYLFEFIKEDEEQDDRYYSHPIINVLCEEDAIVYAMCHHWSNEDECLCALITPCAEVIECVVIAHYHASKKWPGTAKSARVMPTLIHDS